MKRFSLQVEGHINFNIGDLLQIKLFNREKNNAAEMLAFNDISDKLETVLKRLEAVEGYGSICTPHSHRKMLARQQAITVVAFEFEALP